MTLPRPISLGTLEIARVAVVDDEPEYAEGTGLLIEDAGLIPIVLKHGFGSAAELVETARTVADAAICDHRLRRGGYGPFDGAEAVAKLFDVGVPSILLTTYDKIDADVSIRLWRDRIPVLLSRDAVDPARIRVALQDCLREVLGDTPESRVAWKALIEVRGIDDESKMRVVDAVIANWRPNEAIRFPLDLLPVEMRDGLQTGDLLVGDVNVGCERQEDLYFRNLRAAHAPISDGFLD